MDKINKLANLLLDYSLKATKGKKIILEASIEAKPLINNILKEATKREVSVHLILNDDDFSQNLALNKIACIPQFENTMETIVQMYENMDGYINIRAVKNEYNTKKVTQEQMQKISQIARKSLDVRLSKNWCILKWPTHAYAQKAQMNYDDYFEFCLDSMVINYNQMAKNLEPLKKLMEKTNDVKIIGPETNLTFSIKDIPAVICSGLRNIPDGEVYSAPVIDSVNGTIKYNTKSMYNGILFENVKLTFKDGKIIDAECSNTTKDELMKVFEIDSGARYVGEFSLGVNNNIVEPIGDILYDEKIGGSFHFTPGNAYEKANNGNKSSLHWDLVCIQNSNFGGGEIYFDNVLIRKDGKFLLKELELLNK